MMTDHDQSCKPEIGFFKEVWAEYTHFGAAPSPDGSSGARVLSDDEVFEKFGYRHHFPIERYEELERTGNMIRGMLLDDEVEGTMEDCHK